jgi:glycosyltransferase involved in cell wall biosynthesis
MRILVLTKRQYMNKDLIDDRFGRFREIPLALAQKGHRVQGLCLSYLNKTEGLFDDGPVRWQSINTTIITFPGLLRFLIRSYQYARHSDVIWACSDSFYGVIGCFLSRLCNKPVIFDIYDNFAEFFVAKLPIMKQLYHWAIRHSDAVTCLSKSFARFIQDEYGRSEHVYPIEFAVRSDLFRPLDKTRCRKKLGLPTDAVLIGTAGGLYKNRDVHLLIETFLQLKNKHRDMHLALAGPIDNKIHIPDDPRVHYLGILPFERVPYLINSLDVAVVCYADDEYGKYCFPQKTREFLACDVPTIAAKVGALEELFAEHPQWLYAPGDVKSLIEVLQSRLSDKTTDYAEAPNWENLAELIENIMRQIQDDKNRSHQTNAPSKQV